MALFDGITYYWSSQDPNKIPASFDQIRAMGDKVHAGQALVARLHQDTIPFFSREARPVFRVGTATPCGSCGVVTPLQIQRLGLDQLE